MIDLPQIVDPVGNPAGSDFLLRDCANVCSWFRGCGLDVDEHEPFGERLAHAFRRGLAEEKRKRRAQRAPRPSGRSPGR